jgi:hypothetical protein
MLVRNVSIVFRVLVGDDAKSIDYEAFPAIMTALISRIHQIHALVFGHFWRRRATLGRFG